MAVNTQFEAYKIEREIRKNGVYNVFYRPGINAFGEPDNTLLSTVGGLNALYHEQSGFIQVAVANEVQYRTKKQPMMMSLLSDVKALGLQIGDFTIIDNKKYTVIAIANLYNWDILADISLEVSDYGAGAAV